MGIVVEILAKLAGALATASVLAFPIESIGQDVSAKQTLVSVEGSKVSLPDVLQVLDSLGEHESDTGLEMLLRIDTLKSDLLLMDQANCGREAEFSTKFEMSGFGNFQQSRDERNLMIECMKDIYVFLDSHLNSTAPGSSLAHSESFLLDAADVAHRCGYRSERLFRIFSIATWLFGLDEVQAMTGFQCIENPLPNFEKYSEDTLLFELNRAVKKALFIFRVTGDWKYVRSYTVYEEIVLANREKEGCRSVLSSEQLMALFVEDRDLMLHCLMLVNEIQ